MCLFVFTSCIYHPCGFWLIFMFVRSCPCQMLHSRTYVLVVSSSLPKLCCQSDSPFLFLHIASQSSFYRRAIIHYAVTQTLYFVVPILELLPSMGVTSSFSTLRVFLWRLAVCRLHSFSDVDTVFYLSIYQPASQPRTDLPKFGLPVHQYTGMLYRCPYRENLS